MTTSSKLESVQKSIDGAVKAGATMVAKCREAAIAAAAQLDPKFALKERIDAVVSMYDFAGNNNVKSIFKDQLTLLACADTEVEIKVSKDTVAHIKAGDVVRDGKSKHNIKDAVKQVRDAKGIGRAAGAGRKSYAKEQKVEAAKPSKPVALTADQLHAPILSSVNTRFESEDSVFIDKLAELAKRHGYILTKQ